MHALVRAKDSRTNIYQLFVNYLYRIIQHATAAIQALYIVYFGLHSALTRDFIEAKFSQD